MPTIYQLAVLLRHYLQPTQPEDPYDLLGQRVSTKLKFGIYDTLSGCGCTNM